MNIRDFKKRLAKHDWNYMFSDDSRVYERGRIEEAALNKLIDGKKTYQKAYETYFRKHFNRKK